MMLAGSLDHDEWPRVVRWMFVDRNEAMLRSQVSQGDLSAPHVPATVVSPLPGLMRIGVPNGPAALPWLRSYLVPW